MKSYNGILDHLLPYKANLLQVAEYSDPFGKPGCIIIFDKDPEYLMRGIKDLRLWCARNRLQFPLVVDRSFIESSQDSYPLELLSFSHQYRNIYDSTDLLATLKLEKADVRLQMERELKSKWLHTRMALLSESLNEAKIARLIKVSITAILPVFKGFLYLSGTGIPQNLAELVDQTQQTTGIDLSLIRSLIASSKTNTELALSYLSLISSLLKHLDEVAL